MGSLCHFCVTPTHLSYIGFPFLKLPPPPCAVLLVNIPALWFASGESTGKGRFFGLGAAGSQGQHCHLCPRGALQKKKRQNRQMLKALRRRRVVSPWSMGTEKEWCLRNPICQVLRPLYFDHSTQPDCPAWTKVIPAPRLCGAKHPVSGCSM